LSWKQITLSGKAGRQADRVRARDLLCYGCAVELGMTMAELARRLELTPAAVSHAVRRGEKTAREMGWHVEESVI